MDNSGILCSAIFLNMAVTVLTTPYARWAEKHTIDMNPETHPSLRNHALRIKVNIGEFMEITCPQYDPATPKSKTLQFHVKDMHDGKSFKACDIDDKQTVLSCDSPYTTTKLTMKFQKISPYPLGFTFQEGKSYYYIAIPVDENDCRNAMKLIVDVQKDDVVVPPLDPFFKEGDEPLVSSPTPSTTTKSTTKFTTERAITPKRIHQSSTTSGTSSTPITRALSLIVLMSLMGSWMNW